MSSNLPLSQEELDGIIEQALLEDRVSDDVTTASLIPPSLIGKAVILIKEEGVIAGGEIANSILLHVDPGLEVKLLIGDGSRVMPGDKLATISGSAGSILKAERVTLNFLQRLSGIATLTSRFVAEAEGYKACIVDTRKTTPGLRLLEKYAVRMGGGKNHRLHLADGILIKDNHLAALRSLSMSLPEILVKAKQNARSGFKVEVEVTSLQEARDVVEGGADIVMLDNMSLEDMREAVALVAGRAKIEASGGITLANVRQVAMTGVDIISVGALTHSPKAMDISLELDPESLRLP